jgi:tyrosine-protein phosphatase SIW14
MMRPFLLLFLAAVSVLLRSLSAHQPPQRSATSEMHSAYGEKLRVPAIPNSGKINEHLYRGAQPKTQGLAELKKLGITTIVDLRGEDREKVLWERRQAESLGIRFVNIPVSGWAPPTNEQVLQFLSYLRDDPTQKIFVHCRYGDDRTGVFIATYRMAIEKWPAEQALKEMYFFGFNGFWHPSMITFVREFPARLNSAPALAPLRTPPSPQ